MSTSERQDEINESDCNDLIGSLYEDAATKVANKGELTKVEERVYLLINMLLVSEMEGFVDLFHQFYSLRECVVVEETLNLIGLKELADLFRKAKDIYTFGSKDISSNDDFHDMYFQLSEEQRCHLDEIGAKVLAKESDIYEIGNKLCQYVKENLYF